MPHEDFKMPFGKHKGDALKDIADLTYLDYIVGFDDLYDDTKAALEGFMGQDHIQEKLKAQLDEKERKRG